jgi:hypothetical protein
MRTIKEQVEHTLTIEGYSFHFSNNTYHIKRKDGGKLYWSSLAYAMADDGVKYSSFKRDDLTLISVATEENDVLNIVEEAA